MEGLARTTQCLGCQGKRMFQEGRNGQPGDPTRWGLTKPEEGEGARKQRGGRDEESSRKRLV